MSQSEIIDKLKEILFSIDPTKANLICSGDLSINLFTELGFTSVSMIYMVVSIEEKFGIRFDDAVGVYDFVTLGDVVEYIEGKL